MDKRIFHLKKELHNKPEHQWTVKEMAEFTKMSETHFQKLFKVNTGMPPIAYLSDLRLEKARELLEGDEFLQIQEIRAKVGIWQDSHFTRDFKKKFGVTPKEYRKQFWEKEQGETQIGKK
jgi:AraC family transcriptional regulator, alkane utilization regulator